MNLHAYKAHTHTRKCDKPCPNGSEAKRDSYLHQQQQQGLAVFLVFSSFLYISYSCLCCCRSLCCSLCYCCCWPGHGLSWRRCCCRCCCRCSAAAVAAVVGFLIGPTETAKLCRGCSGLFCLPSTGKVFKIRVCKKTALLETTTCPARRR